MAKQTAVPEEVAGAGHPAKGRAAPIEDQLMGRIRRALRLLPDDEARERVIAYLASRYRARPKQAPALFDGLTSWQGKPPGPAPFDSPVSTREN